MNYAPRHIDVRLRRRPRPPTSSWHRFADGADLTQLPLEATADLPALVVDAGRRSRRAIDHDALPSDEAADAFGRLVADLIGVHQRDRREPQRQ